MRLGALVSAASLLSLAAMATAQDYSSGQAAKSSVIRPAATVAWRNYVTVPDGPCGHPMSVQADCYNVCRPCGPFRPICFLHRVGRMLDCLIPCNLCCNGGGGGCGGGPFHGCVLGGKSWGHCNVCCGGGGSCGGGSCGCVHPCGSAFESCCAPSCTTGGHCHGCSSALPGLADPFQDDPMPPKPTAAPATEVRRAPVQRPRPVAAPARSAMTPAPKSSPYKIVAAPANPYARYSTRPSAPKTNVTATANQPAASQSVLRRTSAEQDSNEPQPIKVDHQRAAPIVRSQSPESAEYYEVPENVLRR